MKLRVDMTQFTFGDAIDLEEQGFTLKECQRLITSGEVPVKLAVVLMWIFRRKEEPTFTYADAAATPITDGLDLDMVGDDTDPKADPGDDSPPSASGPVGRPRKPAPSAGSTSAPSNVS
jgi:hypothetical protein